MRTLASRTARNPLRSWAAILVLGFYTQRQRRLLGEVIRGPKPIKQIESQVTSERLFDNLAVALAAARRPHLDCAKDFGIDRQGCADFWHVSILASPHRRCALVGRVLPPGGVRVVVNWTASRSGPTARL